MQVRKQHHLMEYSSEIYNHFPILAVEWKWNISALRSFEIPQIIQSEKYFWMILG